MQKKSSKLKFALKNHTVLSNFRRHFFFKYSGDDVKDQNKLAKLILNYKFDCEHPRSFNEYLVWIKINYRDELWMRCADKLGSKEFLIEKGFERYVPKTFQIANSVNEIDFSSLPERFVIKTNNDSGSVFLLNKNNDNKEKLDKLQSSLHKDYSKNSLEWVYSKIEPKVFVEEVLEPAEGKDLIDYKFFVFNGKAQFGFSAHQRTFDTRFYPFDREYNELPFEYIYLKPKNKPKKPDNWNELLELAEKVGSFFQFARVDLYNTTKGPKIGEITFFSQSGMGPFVPKKMDFEMGKYFEDTIFNQLSKK